MRNMCVYSPNNLMLQSLKPSHWPLGSRKYFECFIIYGHGDHCKVGIGQPRIIICDNLLEPTFPTLHTMLHTMYKTHGSFDFRDNLKGFYLVWAWYGKSGSKEKAPNKQLDH